MRALVFAAALLPLLALSPQSDQRPVFSSDVELVTLAVAVLDEFGDPIQDLDEGDFTIIEDGVPQPVAILLPPGRTPLDIALLIDLSNSMQRQGWQDRANDFLDALNERDCVFLLGFSTEVGGSVWGQPDDHILRDAIDDATAMGGTALNDALLVGLTELDRSQTSTTLRGSTRSSLNPEAPGRNRVRARPNNVCPVTVSAFSDPGTRRRRAVVVVSDGFDSTSRANTGDVRVAAQLGGVPIFPIRIEAERGFRGGRPGRRRFEASVLDELAELTGGRVVAADQGGYLEVLAWLRGSYIVGYYSSGSTGAAGQLEFERHDVRVTVERPRARVLHQPAYYRSSIDSAAARRDVGEGIELTEDGEPEAALLLFDRASRSDPGYAPAYFHRALVLAQQGRFEEARAEALRAAAAGPGTVQFHELAMLLSLDLADADEAWSQAILAAQGGGRLDEHLDRLEAAGPAPSEFATRIAAPRLAVARPWVDATNLMIEAALTAVLQQTRKALATAPDLGLVVDPTFAKYVVTIAANEVSERPPRRFEGTITVEDRNGDDLYRERLSISDVSDSELIAKVLERHVVEIQKKLNR